MDVLSLEHYFGKEIETSFRQLFNYFCNNINLGQWKAAKACLKQLSSNKKNFQFDLGSLLAEIVENPEHYMLVLRFAHFLVVELNRRLIKQSYFFIDSVLVRLSRRIIWPCCCTIYAVKTIMWSEKASKFTIESCLSLSSIRRGTGRTNVNRSWMNWRSICSWTNRVRRRASR